MPGQPVLAPLQVRVANGAAAVAGARVRLRVLGGGGTLGATGHVLTDANGLAQTAWTLGSAGVQRARAELLDPKGDPVPNQFIDFGADLSVAANVAYTPGCADLQNARTVQEALDLLCQRPTGGGCEVTVGEGGEFATLEQALTALLKENQILMLGLMGHFQLRGNRLTRLAVSEAMVQALIGATQDGEGRRVFYNLFGSCLLSDNLFDSGRSLLVSQHAVLGTSVFSFTADPPPPTTGTAAPARRRRRQPLGELRGQPRARPDPHPLAGHLPYAAAGCGAGAQPRVRDRVRGRWSIADGRARVVRRTQNARCGAPCHSPLSKGGWGDGEGYLSPQATGHKPRTSHPRPLRL
ncbi:MAG: hypothetical protein C4333_13905 [Meiothermus sp.]